MQNTPDTYVHIFVGAPTTCGNEKFALEVIIPTAEGTENDVINPGYVEPPAKALCAHSPGTVTANVSAYGYLVASGDVPAPHARPAATSEPGRP